LSEFIMLFINDRYLTNRDQQEHQIVTLTSE